jgi:hypothetical protein
LAHASGVGEKINKRSRDDIGSEIQGSLPE